MYERVCIHFVDFAILSGQLQKVYAWVGGSMRVRTLSIHVVRAVGTIVRSDDVVVIKKKVYNINK